MFTAVALLALSAAAAPRLDVAEPDRHFRGGETIVRTLVLTNATSVSLNYRIQWKTLVNPAVIQSGKIDLNARPGETVRRAVSLKTPSVRRPVELNWLIDGGPETAFKNVKFNIYPTTSALTWSFLKDKQVRVYEHGSRIQDFLVARGVKVVRITDPDEPIERAGEFVIIQSDPSEARIFSNHVSRWARWWANDHGSFPFILFAAEATTAPVAAARIVDPSHTLFRDIGPGDLSGWSSDGLIASMMLPAPVGRFRRILAPGDAGSTGSLLLEGFNNGGDRGYIATLAIPEKLGKEPVCELLLNAMLRLQAAWMDQTLRVEKPKMRVRVLTDPKSVSGSLMNEVLRGNVSRESNGAIDSKQIGVVILDASHQPSATLRPTLDKFIRDGGNAILMNLSASDDLTNWALGGHKLVAADSSTMIALTDKAYPLLGGMDQSDWRALAPARSESQLPAGIQDATVLVEPGIVAVRKIGNGRLILIQLDPENMPNGNLSLILGQLLTRLGIILDTMDESE